MLFPPEQLNCDIPRAATPKADVLKNDRRDSGFISSGFLGDRFSFRFIFLFFIDRESNA
jgi:hypothetical protein